MESSFDQFITRYRDFLANAIESSGGLSFLDVPPVMTLAQAEVWRRVKDVSLREEWTQHCEACADEWHQDIKDAQWQINEYLNGELGDAVQTMVGSYKTTDGSEGVTVIVVDDGTAIWLSGASEHPVLRGIKTWLQAHSAKSGELPTLQLPKQIGDFWLTGQSDIRPLFEAEVEPRV